MLVAYGAAVAAVERQRVVYRISDRGRALVGQLRSIYATAYRSSAEVVMARLDLLSDKRLHEDAKRWLNDERLLIDLYDVDDDQDAVVS